MIGGGFDDGQIIHGHILACTFAGAFVGSLLADEPKLFNPPPAANLPPPLSMGTQPRGLWQNFEEALANDRALNKATEQLPSEAQRTAISQILTELRSMTYDQILVLSLSSDVCQQIGCQGTPSDTVRRFIERYLNTRIAR
jgi:hypothetical protein